MQAIPPDTQGPTFHHHQGAKREEGSAVLPSQSDISNEASLHHATASPFSEHHRTASSGVDGQRQILSHLPRFNDSASLASPLPPPMMTMTAVQVNVPFSGDSSAMEASSVRAQPSGLRSVSVSRRDSFNSSSCRSPWHWLDDGSDGGRRRRSPQCHAQRGLSYHPHPYRQATGDLGLAYSGRCPSEYFDPCYGSFSCMSIGDGSTSMSGYAGHRESDNASDGNLSDSRGWGETSSPSITCPSLSNRTSVLQYFSASMPGSGASSARECCTNDREAALLMEMKYRKRMGSTADSTRPGADGEAHGRSREKAADWSGRAKHHFSHRPKSCPRRGTDTVASRSWNTSSGGLDDDDEDRYESGLPIAPVSTFDSPGIHSALPDPSWVSGSWSSSRYTSPPSRQSIVHHSIGLGDSSLGGINTYDNAMTMDDIELQISKRRCVESPTSSPSRSTTSSPSLRGGRIASQLSEVLAALPSKVAMPGDPFLRHRQRRGASPSLARPDDADIHFDAVRWGSRPAPRGRGRAPSAIRTAAPSLQRPSTPLSPRLPSLTQRCCRSLATADPRNVASSLEGALPHGRPCSEEWTTAGPGVAGDVEGSLSPLQRCSSSDGEPEVDAVAYERAQALLEDADAVALLAVAGPAEEEERGSCARTVAQISADEVMGGDFEEDGAAATVVRVGTSQEWKAELYAPAQLTEQRPNTRVVSGALMGNEASSSLFSPTRCATATPDHQSSEWATFQTVDSSSPPHTDPIDATPSATWSCSTRDASPPIRDRSLAPAELMKERALLFQ